ACRLAARPHHGSDPFPGATPAFPARARKSRGHDAGERDHSLHSKEGSCQRKTISRSMRAGGGTPARRKDTTMAEPHLHDHHDATAGEHTVDVNGIRLHYEIHGAHDGPSGARPPLLLLHGFTGSAGDWLFAGRDQLARGHLVIAPDARGHGSSTNAGEAITH